MCEAAIRAADGQACGLVGTDFVQCATGSACVDGKCGKARVTGETCESGQCAGALACVSGKCSVRLGAGAACSQMDSNACGTSLECIGGKCTNTRTLDLGASCSFDSPARCKSGLRCNGATASTPGKCTAVPGEGQACTGEVDGGPDGIGCDLLLTCENGTCRSPNLSVCK
jgi:hypothetical protein